VFSNLSSHVPHLLRSPRNLTALGFLIAATASLTGYLLTRKRITEEERERDRREHLALTGRITDGSITETHWLANPTADSDSEAASNSNFDSEDQPHPPPPSHTDTPAVLLYRYQIAGVTYECAQDVSPLPNLVRQVRVDLPIQVRFDPRNPGNSIVVAEAWNGLRFQHPSGQPAIAQPQPENIDTTPRGGMAHT
jgi:hypothetical protein